MSIQKLRLEYLDGIRGIAILSVLIQHNFDIYLPLGNLGVLLFFGLSGYLILGLKTKEVSRNSLSNFFINRYFRITPAYIVVIILALLFLPTNSRFNNLNFLTFSTNWSFVSFGDWPAGALTPLWSVSVEMQLYLIAPILIYSRFYKFNYIVLFILSLVLSVIFVKDQSFSGNGGLYYATFTYISTFLAGGLSYKFINYNRFTSYSSMYISFALFIILLFFWNPFPPYTEFTYASILMMPLAVFLFFYGISNIPNESSIRIILKQKILTHLGKISYSLYLSHLLILYIFYDEIQKIGSLNNILKIILILILQIVFANLLYIFIESKFLKYRVKILKLGIRTKYLLVGLIVIPISINFLIMLDLFYD